MSLDAEQPDTGLKLDPPSDQPAPDAALLRAEQLAWVHEAVERLEEPCRELVQLRYFGELSYEELARALQLNIKTVSSRLSRCLDRLEQIARAMTTREPANSSPV